jgi:hypothetical protein
VALRLPPLPPLVAVTRTKPSMSTGPWPGGAVEQPVCDIGFATRLKCKRLKVGLDFRYAQAPFGNFCADTLIASLFLQKIFTHSTLILTYPASQLISRAIYLNKYPVFSVKEDIPAPHQIKLCSSGSTLSLLSVKQPGDSPD